MNEPSPDCGAGLAYSGITHAGPLVPSLVLRFASASARSRRRCSCFASSALNISIHWSLLSMSVLVPRGMCAATVFAQLSGCESGPLPSPLASITSASSLGTSAFSCATTFCSTRSTRPLAPGTAPPS